MKIKTIEAIHIENVGTFIEEDTWNGMIKYKEVNGDRYFIAANDKYGNIIPKIFASINNNTHIIMATPSLLEELAPLEVKKG